MSACAIVPGLRVSEGGEGSHAAGFRVVKITGATLGQATPVNEAFSGELPLLDPARPAPDYVVGPGDVLNVTVWDHPELTNPSGVTGDPIANGRLVAADGTAYFPYVGTFKAAGKTTAEIRQVVIQGLQRVIQGPQVDVRVVGFRSKRVQVTGEVKIPGTVALDDTPKGILEAINERGGLTVEASYRRALLVREGQSYSVDLRGLLSGQRTAGNPLLQPGDSVHVPSGSEEKVFVMGEVVTSAVVPVRQSRITLTEAIATVGGMDRRSASDAGVLVFRGSNPASIAGPDSTDMPTVFALDMSRPEGMLLAGQFELQSRDVVYIKANAFSQYNLIIGELLPTITAVFQLDRLIND